MKSRTFRIPVTGSYMNRVAATNVLDSDSGYIGAGIIGLMIIGKTTTASNKDQRFLNCFGISMVDTVSGKKTIFTVKRPGWGTSNTPASGNIGNAILMWTGYSTGTKCITSFGATNSTIYDGTTSLGAITGKCTGITETTVGASVPTLVMSSTDNTAWYYDVPTASCTKITDADFPGNNGKTITGTFAHMDGYACIATTDGGLYASDLNSVTSWTATSFDTANSYPDLGIAVVRHRNFLMYFGTESIQFFDNKGLSPFPFGKIVSMTVKIGAVSADAIAQIGDSTYWCGSTPQGGLSIYQYDNGVKRISTPQIDTMLILAGASGVSLTTLRNYGRLFVIVIAQSTTLVYNVEENEWFEQNSATPIWYKCVGVSRGGTMVNYAITKYTTTGKVYIQNYASLTFQDDGITYTARAQLDLMDFGTKKKKFFEEIELVGDIETGATASISYTDDDYQTFTTAGTVDLSTDRPRLTRLGSSRRRGWVITNTTNTPFRIEALEGRYKLGLS